MPSDYPDYKCDLTKYEQQMARYKGSNDITFEVFRNAAVFHPEKKSITIYVDDGFEEITRIDELAAYKGEIDDAMDSDEDLELDRINGLIRNRQDFDALSSRYAIDRMFFDCWSAVLYGKNPTLKKAPLNNVTSGAEITLKYGEGFLDFLYTDFSEGFLEAMDFAGISHNSSFGRYGVRVKQQKRLDSFTQRIAHEYMELFSSSLFIHPILYRSIYTAIFPPKINCDAIPADALKRYSEYIAALQEDYLELIEFCFDPNFWPEVLGNMRAVDRYSLHQRIHGLPAMSKRTELFELSAIHSNGATGANVWSVEELRNLFDMPTQLTDAQIAFAESYGIEMKDMLAYLQLPRYLNITYSVRSIAEMLQLEFTKMLEVNMQLKKNPDTGRYRISEDS